MLQIKEVNTSRKLELGHTDVRAILFILSGSGIVNISGNSFEVCRGRVFFLTDEVSLVANVGCLVGGFLVNFNELFFNEFLLHYPKLRECSAFKQVFVDVASGDILALVEELRWLKAENEGEADVMRLTTRFNLVMLLVLGGLEWPMEMEDRLKLSFMSLLESSFRVRRTSGFYAAELGVTMRRLNLLCRNWFDGKRFIEVHRERLLYEAEFLLLETDKSVKEISFDLDFCSQQHFRGYFVREKGMSPSTFRVTFKDKI